MCASPVGNVFVKDFVEFVVTGKKVTGCVHDFLCFEEKLDVFVNIEALEQYPNQFMWLLDNIWSAMRTSECHSVCATRSRNKS